MKNRIYTMLAAIFTLIIFTGLLATNVRAATAATTTTASDETEVRSAMEQAFGQLKSGQYDALYDVLPRASQSRISRARFINALERTRDMYQLDRMEIGAVRVKGDLAVVDTVMYGRVLRPEENEGKIIAQQYMVRENGRWRVATGDAATARTLLAANPGFGKKFPIKNPRIFVKRDGRWIDVSALMSRRRA